MNWFMHDKFDTLLAFWGSASGGFLALAHGVDLHPLSIFIQAFDLPGFLTFCLYTTVGATIPLFIKHAWNKYFGKKESDEE
jgi:hypothetical protein